MYTKEQILDLIELFDELVLRAANGDSLGNDDLYEVSRGTMLAFRKLVMKLP